MLLLRAVLNMLVRNVSPRGPMCFSCMMVSLSGLCECQRVECVDTSPVMTECCVMMCCMQCCMSMSSVM